MPHSNRPKYPGNAGMVISMRTGSSHHARRVGGRVVVGEKRKIWALSVFDFQGMVASPAFEGFQEDPGGVFLTVITTSQMPFAVKSPIAGNKYLPTGTR